MNKIYILTKIFFKNSESNNKPTYYSLSSLLISILIFCGMVGFVSVVVIPKIASPIYDLFDFFNQKEEFLNLSLAIITILNFRFGLSFSTTALYSTKEVEMLLPLPIKFSQILSAKFLWILLFQIALSTVFLAPLLIVYGTKASLGIFYWIASILVVLILPIVPTAISTFLSIVALRFTNIGKYKEKFKAIGIVWSLILVIVINVFFPSDMLSGANENTILNIIMIVTHTIVGFINFVAPTTKCATNFLIGFSNFQIVINLLLFILISICAVIIFIIIGENLYFKSVIGTSESFAKKEKLSDKKFEKSTKENSQFKSYTLKEFKLLIRNPAFLAISIGINFIFPILILWGGTIKGNTTVLIQSIYDFLMQKELLGIVICVIYGVILILNANNILASTAVTREGSNMYINKYIPMCYKKQMFSKLFSILIINFISSLLMVLVFIVVFKISIGISIFMILVTVIANIISSSVGLIIDINRPKFNWDDEYSILRMNTNNFLNVVINVLIGGLIIFLALSFKPTLIVASVSIVIFSFIMITSVFYYIITKGTKVYSKIE